MLILHAEDNPADRNLAQVAVKEAGLDCDLRFVEDGEELLAYLRREGPYGAAPRPQMILLDLNMPRKNGLEALAEMKSHRELWEIPIVVVLTSSVAEDDVRSAYDAGASTYLAKPRNFDDLVQLMRTFKEWWTETVELPRPRGEYSPADARRQLSADVWTS